MAVSHLSWLDALAQQTNVDIDSMDPTSTLSLLPIIPHDMTSNQGYVHEQMCHPANENLFRDVVKEYKDQGWEEIYARMVALMCKANIDNIKGRVLVQTLPTSAYDTEKTLESARAYAREFEKVGISKDQFCIKIPSTGPALNACPILLTEGIRTLATAVFSVHQAIAASQAGCLYISPYYNDIQAHKDPQFWPKTSDPALLHPFSSRFIQILETYKRLYKETGKEQPFVKHAGFLSPEEAMAAGEIGCHSVTIPYRILKKLSERSYDSSQQPGKGVPKPDHPYLAAAPTPARLQTIAQLDPLAPKTWDGKLASDKIDYLADGGALLDKSNDADPETKRRLHEALEFFIEIETKSRAKIEEAMKTV
ncbi:hypothetical protein N7532_006796 [Penicillium argentinense]|uniref:Transaldolase n=1 Tax=Penicillium argentinense TaxID=1131581 RepID=A0A9W9KB59_9EURO|nr:uncharacterized protein N7532_006796 [Penicillium argentinense]KAJ5099795.1 hypothetical protein N7532_006796 [Penicillium argentinense]